MIMHLRTWVKIQPISVKHLNQSASSISTNQRPTMNKRSYVMITKGQETGRIAQVIDYLHDKSVYAVMINYNGYVRFVKTEFLRKPTKQEKNKDKKQHNLELQLDRYQRTHFNGLIYTY
jgi:hypothetical protein